MAFTENIKLVVDVVTGNAKSGLSSIKSDMDAAEGGFGKLKAAGSGAFSAIGQMGPQILAGGAAAIGAFALKSIDAFQKTALAADKFRDTTGASLDESSRWIAVADDVGVSAETMQGAFVKMEKAMAANKSAFGDLIVTAKDGSTDMSATFLNAVTHLQSIQDPIQRANESAKLFGKGFAEVSQIITTDADQIKTALEGVSEAQIIDEDEVRKAREYQAAMDELGDAFKDISIAAGESLVPIATALAGMASGVVAVTDKVGGLETVIRSLPIVGNVMQLQTAFDGSASSVDRLGGAVGAVFPLAGTLIASLDGNTKAASESMGQLGSAADFAGGEFAAAAGDMDLLAGATGAAGAQAAQLEEKWAELLGTLSTEEATLNLQEAFAGVNESAVKAFEDTASGAENAAGSVRDHQQEVVQLKQRVVDYGAEIAGLPPEVVSDILAMIDRGSVAEAEAALLNAARERQAQIDARANTAQAERDLQSLTRTRNMTVNAQIVSRGGAGFGTTPAFQEGGMVPGPEGKPLLAVVHGGEMVVPSNVVNGAARGGVASVSGGGSPTVIHFHGPVLGDKATIGRYMDEAIAESRRRGNRAS